MWIILKQNNKQRNIFKIKIKKIIYEKKNEFLKNELNCNKIRYLLLPEYKNFI